MASEKKPGQDYSEQEAARRRDNALRRALSTPPKPHKPTVKKKASPKVRSRNKVR